MVKIRARRTGSKFNATYQFVAADARAPRDGRFIEKIGHYDPRTKALVINEELKTKWLNYGAKPTETVKTLFKKYEATKVGSDKQKAISKQTKKVATEPKTVS